MSDIRDSNTVFQNQEAQPPPTPQHSSPPPSVNTVKEYEIPVEAIPLPSNGVVYPKGSPLHNATTVDIRAMTAKDEDILMSRALIKNGTVISKLLEACLTDKNIKATDMLAGDRNAVMVGLRTIGYGADYEVGVECPDCEHHNDATFNLTNVPIKSLELVPNEAGENYFEFRLPVSKKIVGFKFLTGRDEEDMSKTQARKKKKGFKDENLVTQRLVYSIVTLDGESDRGKVGNMVRNMLARDSLALRRHIDKHEPGIDLSDYMTCDACGEESKVNIPLGVSFFWPDAGA